jgi:hypothetical protein
MDLFGHGQGCPGGIYLYRLRAEDFTQTMKPVLQK